MSQEKKCCLCRATAFCCWNDTLKGFVCPVCYHAFDHYSPNEKIIGKPGKRLPPFSFEFEVACSNPLGERQELERAMLLIKYGFKRTYDGSVDDEYKSPIYSHIRDVRKPLSVMDSLSDLVSDQCGTHLHVQCHHKRLLKPLQGEVFSPLLTQMLTDSLETTRFWGRYFCYHATPVNRDRYHCFSLESSYPTIEFRLARFRSAEQYLRLIKFARAAVAYLDTMLFEISQRCSQEQDLIGLPGPGALGQHVLWLYRRHVARMPAETCWFTHLSPTQQQIAQGFNMERPVQEREEEEDDDDDADF